MVDVDLVLLAVGGVQRLLAESRKTVDMAGSSIVFRRVVLAAAKEAESGLRNGSANVGMVFPAAAALDSSSAAPVGVTNRIAFVAEAGSGAALARRAAKAGRDTWGDLVRQAYPGQKEFPGAPGMPDISWVCVHGELEKYQDLWERARAAMVRRRRARVFDPGSWSNIALCAQSPALPAGPVPRDADRRDRNERFSVAGWTKRAVGNRAYPPGNRFPSTGVVASAAYRARLLGWASADPAFADRLRPVVAELDGLLDQSANRRHQELAGVTVPEGLEALSTRLGVEVSPHVWDRADAEDFVPESVDTVRGRALARRIAELAREAEIVPLSPYFAVIVQDLDHLGKRMGMLSLADQRSASRALVELGRAQLEIARTVDHLAVPVYAGGDDFVALAPAAHAVEFAARLRRLVTERLADTPLAGATASTAVVFAHFARPLRVAVAAAQRALPDAKDALGPGGAHRDVLTVAAVRRGGERSRTVLPWQVNGLNGDVDTVAALRRIAPDPAAGELSARLAAGLEHDRVELDELARARWGDVLAAEVGRRVIRHDGDATVAELLTALGLAERSGATGQLFHPRPAALVARFLSQECR